jgi:hypothetical protein
MDIQKEIDKPTKHILTGYQARKLEAPIKKKFERERVAEEKKKEKEWKKSKKKAAKEWKRERKILGKRLKKPRRILRKKQLHVNIPEHTGKAPYIPTFMTGVIQEEKRSMFFD